MDRRRPADERVDAPLRLLRIPRTAALHGGTWPSPRRIGAFFDVDKTILAENSGPLYFKAALRAGRDGLASTCWRTWLVPAVQAEPARHRALDQVDDAAVRGPERGRAGSREAVEWFKSTCCRRDLPRGGRAGPDHIHAWHVVALVTARPSSWSAAGRVPRRRAPCTRTSRGGGRQVHGARDRPDLLRRGQDLLAAAADRARGRSTWRRATSTPTRSLICRYSNSLATPRW